VVVFGVDVGAPFERCFEPRLNVLAPPPRDRHLAVMVGEGRRPGGALCGRRQDLAAGCHVARCRQTTVNLAGTGNGQADDFPAGINGTCYLLTIIGKRIFLNFGRAAIGAGHSGMDRSTDFVAHRWRNSAM